MERLLRLKLEWEAGAVERGPIHVPLEADAHGVEVGLVFDLDDIGAEVGEDAGGLGAGDDPGEVADADPVEREGRVGRHERSGAAAVRR